MEGESSESNETRTTSKVLFVKARGLNIERGQNTDSWDWNCLKEVGDDGNEVAKLKDIAWFSVRGEINTSQLPSEIEYEVFYEIKLKQRAKGWELPVTLELSTHVGESWSKSNIISSQARQLSLLDQPRGIWIKLSVGRFTVKANDCKDILFDLKETNVHQRKGGLLIRGASIRPRIP